MARQVRRHAPAPALLALGLLAVLAAVLVGCGGPPAEPESPFPARPADIDVATLDPCTTLTEQRRADMQLSEGRPANVPVGEVPSRACAWSNFDDGFNYTVQLIPIDAAAVVGTDTSSLTQISGFGAIQGTGLGGSTPTCQLIVDAGPGQAIRVQAQSTLLDDKGQPLTFDHVCPRVSSFATAVVESALAQS